MTHDLKVIGLAIVVVLAMGVAGVPAVSAQQGHLETEIYTLTGTETGEATANRLTAFAGFVECPGSIYTGHQWEVTPHNEELDGATTATITPHYKQVDAEGAPNCAANFGWRVTVDMNGCDYVAHLGELVEENTYDVTFDVVCPGESEIEAAIWTSEESHTAELESPFCVLGIPAQTGLGGAHAIDTTNGYIDLEGTVTGITATKSNQGHGGIFCENAETESASLDLDITVGIQLTAAVGIGS